MSANPKIARSSERWKPPGGPSYRKKIIDEKRIRHQSKLKKATDENMSNNEDDDDLTVTMWKLFT